MEVLGLILEMPENCKGREAGEVLLGIGLESRRRSLPAVDWRQEALVLQRFGLASFQFRLAQLGGLLGAGSGFEFGLLAEISPACLALFHALAALVLLCRCFRVLLTLDHSRHATGLIGADVVTDYRVGSSKFFAVQTVSGLQWVRGETATRAGPRFESPTRLR